jgi:hypothetical protein
MGACSARRLPAATKALPQQPQHQACSHPARTRCTPPPHPAPSLQGAGLLKATNLRHHHEGSPEVPTLYRINDRVEFHIDISESSLEGVKPYE